MGCLKLLEPSPVSLNHQPFSNISCKEAHVTQSYIILHFQYFSPACVACALLKYSDRQKSLVFPKKVFLRHFDFGVSKVEKPSEKTWCPRRLLIVSPACHSWHLPPCTPRRREQPQAQWSVGSGKHPAFGRSIPVCIAIDYVMPSLFSHQARYWSPECLYE